MRVVIVGARNRSEIADTKLVYAILDECIAKYGKLMVVTKACDRGVGKIIKSRCLDSNKPNVPEFDMVEMSLRHYLIRELPRSEFLGDFNTLNAALVEIGDEFHLLTEEEPRGSMLDMLIRVQKADRPCAVYKPSEADNGPKKPVLANSTHSSTLAS